MKQNCVTMALGTEGQHGREHNDTQPRMCVGVCVRRLSAKMRLGNWMEHFCVSTTIQHPHPRLESSLLIFAGGHMGCEAKPLKMMGWGVGGGWGCCELEPMIKKIK